MAFATGSGLPGDQIWDMVRDTKGRTWVATDEGLCEFDIRQGRCSRVIGQDDGLPNNDLITLREGSNGELIVSTTEGVSIITFEDGVASVRNLSVDDGLAGNVIYGISSDRYGRIWIGSDQGLSVIDGERVSSFTTADGLPLDDIHSLLSDRNDVMWVGTNGGGLAEFDPPEPGSGEAPRFVAYGSETGINPYIAGMIEDEEGKLWLATFRGAMLFDPELAREGEHAVLAVVDRSSGLVSNEVNGFTFDHDGNLWIAAAGGATRYDPEAVRADAPRPRVTIEAVVTPDVVWTAPFSRPAVERSRREWLEDEEIDLPPRSASIRIDYRGLSYRGPRRVTYQVRLAGFRDEWSDATSTTGKEYTILVPVHYTVQGRASNAPDHAARLPHPAWESALRGDRSKDLRAPWPFVRRERRRPHAQDVRLPRAPCPTRTRASRSDTSRSLYAGG